VRGTAPRAAVALALSGLLGAAPAGAQSERRADRVVYSVHVDVADQLGELDLAFYLREATLLLQRSQGGVDAPCCVRLDAVELERFGTPGDGLDVIDSELEWQQLGSRRAIVQSIRWCGQVRPAILGCAETPGERLAVALDTDPEDMAIVLAHERGHNAGLTHRTNDACALMRPSVYHTQGCVNGSECSVLRALASAPGPHGSCDCLDAVGAPPRGEFSPCAEDGRSGVCRGGGVCQPPLEHETCAAALELPPEGALLSEWFGGAAEASPTCGQAVADVWFSYRAPCTGELQLAVCNSGFPTLLEARQGCSSGGGVSLACGASCNLAGCRDGGACTSAAVLAGEDLRLRVARSAGIGGPFLLRTDCEENLAVDADQDGLTLARELQLGCDPLDPDSDGDGVLDGGDNCPLTANAEQLDSGGAAGPGDAGLAPDGWGDACQCGDLDDDGRAGEADVAAFRSHLAHPGQLALSTAKCRVWPGSSACDLAQLAVLWRAAQGQGPGIAPVCAAARRS
jgi:hypothetical protein